MSEATARLGSNAASAGALALPVAQANLRAGVPGKEARCSDCSRTRVPGGCRQGGEDDR